MFAMGPAFFKQAVSYATLTLSGSFAAATVGVPYSSSLAIAGGLAPYSLTGGTGLASGTLPAGLSLSISGSTLVLSGTPTTAASNSFTASIGSTDSQVATSAQSIVVAAGATYTTLDPAYKGSGVTLSGGNLIATSSSSSAGLVRAIKALTGKKYFEVELTTQYGSGAIIAAGICNSSELSTAALGYSSANGWALWGDSIGVRHASTTLVASATATSGVVGVAFDSATGNLWFRYNGVWLGTGSPDPATGVAPNYTGITGAIYPAVSPWGALNKLTARFDPASFSNTAPSGFSPVTA